MANDFYSQLRHMGHGPIRSFSKCLNLYLTALIPAASQTPIEIKIEERVSELEEILNAKVENRPVRAKGNLVPSRDPIPVMNEEDYIDSIIQYLDPILMENENLFSKLQVKRYEKTLVQLAENYPTANLHLGNR